MERDRDGKRQKEEKEFSAWKGMEGGQSITPKTYL